MNRSLLISLLCAAPAFAQTADCRAVRRTLELAQERALDTEVVFALEREVCQGSLVFGGGSECADATTLWTLGRLVDSPAMPLIESQRALLCKLDVVSTGRLTWPTGQTFRATNGALYWPGGAVARSVGGLWYYPSGTTARSAGGALFYPTGASARSVAGSWFLPEGRAVDERGLTTAACLKASDVCHSWLDYLETTTGNARDLGLLSLGWLARR